MIKLRGENVSVLCINCVINAVAVTLISDMAFAPGKEFLEIQVIIE